MRNLQDLAAVFEDIWNGKGGGPGAGTAQFWDGRAHELAAEFANDEEEKRCSYERVKAAERFLIEKGALNSESDVIDIGCGLGQYAVSLAKIAKSVAATDISRVMLEYAAKRAAEQEIGNISYIPCDFKKTDPGKMGWTRRFDLVFTSLTPAINGSGLDKINAMSRGWCFNISYVQREDRFLDDMLGELFGVRNETKVTTFWNRFYTLINILMLKGYLPEVAYFKETRRNHLKADPATAQSLAIQAKQKADRRLEELKGPILGYIRRCSDEEGFITFENSITYGWVLWNVNNNHR